MRKLATTILHYFTGVMATRILQFLFLPVYTAYIATDVYGYYDWVVTVIAVALPVLFLSVWDGVLRLGMDARTTAQRRRFFCTALTPALFAAAAIILAGFALQGCGLAHMRSIGLMAAGLGLLQVWSACARAVGDTKAFAAGNVASCAVSIAVNLVLIVRFRMGVEALLIANAAASFSAVAVMEARIRVLRYVRPHWFSPRRLGELTRYVRSFIVATAAWQFLCVSGRLLVPFLLGYEANGIYAVAMKFPAVLGIVTTVYNMAWQEEMIRRAKDEDRSAFFNRVLNGLMRFGIGMLLLVLPVTHLLFPLMVRGAYGAALAYVPILYLEAVLAMLTGHFSSVFIMAKNTRYNLIDTLSGAALSVLLTAGLSQLWGLYGVAAGMLLATVYRLVLCAMLAGRYVAVQADVATLFTGIGAYAAVALSLHTAQSALLPLLLLPLCAGLALAFNLPTVKALIDYFKHLRTLRRAQQQ